MPAPHSSDLILPHPHAQGLSLLHLPAPFSLRLASNASVPLLRNLRTVLRSLAEQQQLQMDVLILTLETVSGSGEYSLALRMKVLDSLIADLGMRRELVVLLPDMPKTTSKLSKLPAVARRNNGRQWRYFMDFYNRFYQVQPEFYFINGHLCSLFKIPAVKLVIASIQTLQSLPDEHLAMLNHNPHDGEAQIEWLARRLDNFSQNGWLRVGVLHEFAAETGDSKLKNLLNQQFNLALTTCKRAHYAECAMPVLSASSSDLAVAEAYQLLRIHPLHIEHWQGHIDPKQADSLPPKQVLTVQLQQVHAAFPQARPALNQPPKPLDDNDNFLSRVAAVCAMRTPGQVEVEHIPAQHNAPAYLRVCLSEAGIARLYPLCACEDTPSAELLNYYCEQVVSRYRRNDPSVTPLFVYGGALPISHALRRAAYAWGVRLYSFVEYQGLIDFRGYLQEQAGLLNNAPDYLPELYVSQSLRFMQSSQIEHSSDALETLRSWFSDAYGRVLLLLGDAGCGKSFLLRELARRLSESDDTLIPIWLPLRVLAHGQTLENLIAQRLAANGVEHFEQEVLHYMIAQGHVLLLLDGLDELAQAVGEPHIQSYLRKLFDLAAGPYAKLIISVRSQYFQSDAEALLALPEHKPTRHYRLAWLECFAPSEVQDYVQNRLGETGGQAHYQALQKLPGLANLARNPRLLQSLCELPTNTLNEAYQHWLSSDAEGATLMQIYAHLVKTWLQREQYRAERLTSRQSTSTALSLSARWHTLKALAQVLWKKTSPRLSAARLSAVVQQTLWTCQGNNEPTLSAPLNSYQAGTTALLKRDSEGMFSFLDDALLDWLIARQTASELERGVATKALVVKPLRPLTVDFLLGKIGTVQALTWARRAMATETDKIIRHNARLLLKRLGDDQHQPLQLTGRNLCGKDLRDWDFRDADLRKTDFSDANLAGVDFSGANLTQARFCRADLTQANLRNCMLQDADFSNAKLFGVDFYDAHLANAKFHRAGLIGAELSGGFAPSIQHSDVFASAPPEPERLHPQLSCGIFAQAVAFSPDGQLLAAGGNRLAVWDVQTRRELRQFQGHTGRVRCVSFTPDGKFLISGADDKTLRLWNLDTGRIQQCLDQHHAAVRCLALSYNGHKLATASWDQQIFLWLWDAQQQQFVYRALLAGHDGVVRGLAFSPDGRYLASASWDKTLRLWLVEQPAREIVARAVLHGHTGFVRSVNFSPDGDHLVSGSSDKSIRLWKLSEDCREAREILCLQGHQRGVNHVEFSPDGHRLYSAADDRSVRVWTVPPATLRHLLHHAQTTQSAQPLILNADNTEVKILEGHRSPVLCLAHHHETLLSGGNDGTLRLWQLDSSSPAQAAPQIIEPSQISLTALAFSKDGQQLLCSGLDKRARLWQLRSGNLQLDLAEHDAGVLSAAFSPDHKLLVTGCEDNRLYLWDADNGKLLRRLLGHDSNVSALAFQPETGILASGSWDKNICLWELEPELPGGHVVRSLSGHRGFIRHLNFSHDGSMLASASSDQTVKLWHSSGSTPSGHCLASFTGHSDCVRCVAFSTDDQWLASGADDKTIRLWHLNAEEADGYLLKAHHGAVNCLQFSPDGKLLASAGSDKHIILWETGAAAKDFRVTHSLHGHQGAINALHFSPNGRLLASAASDGSVRLWDVQRRQCILVLGHLKRGSVAFTPDGRYRLTGEADEQFWHVSGLYRLVPGEADAYMDKHVKMAEDEFLLF